VKLFGCGESMVIVNKAQPGRGATQNSSSTRFNLPEREADGDWLDCEEQVDGLPARPRTTVQVVHPRSIISRNKSPDVPFEQSVNTMQGCEHGCVYCFARPTHAYHDLSPGLDFETKLFAKPNAPSLLRAELARTGYSVKPIAFGTNTDPYQPIEGKWGLTRACLEILAECGHPCSITTKSDRVLRDLDLLAPMAKRGLVAVVLSVPTIDSRTARTLEPRAPAPAKRLAAVRALTDAGVPVHVSIAPVIPQVTDHEMEAILAACATAGARGAFFLAVRLPHEVAPLFRAWLDAHMPDRAAKVMHTIQSIRGGRDNDPNFFTRMKGQGPWADLMATRFRIACARNGLNRERLHLRTDLFRAPAGAQGRLF
jgi:DNA repair photolyase